ncbi:MAG: cell division protein FtsA [Chloroflexi bacterium]|nr:cell division protein FtsA [Chloroflexota bacterium]MDP6498066.1 cell division protein FtsA [Dehalococcoidia bacterium]MDP7586854.1 cell division protein FtsA [Dehalococcoidia bacterium]MQF88550.1 cell division protein FtsA [SAR202 cluster bacterium]MQG55275.1 cell division protein FtsA [SAR202 cluster bacterium]
MARDTFYTAVDIGTDKVTSIMARVGTEGELKVLGTGVVTSQGMQRGRIENIEEVQETVRAAMEEAQRYVGNGAPSGVYTSVTGTHLSSLNTKEVVDNPDDVGDISGKLLDRLLRGSFPDVGPNQEVLHVIPIGYHVDGMSGIRNPVGLHGNLVEVEAHVVMGESVALKNTTKVIEANKATVKQMVLHSLASAEATLSGDEREMGVVLVDIGGGTTDIVIYRQGQPWYSAVIPLGGSQLTRDLSVALKTPLYMTEEMKIKWGSVMPELVAAEEEVVIPSFQGQPKHSLSRRILCSPLHDRMLELIKLIVLKVRQSGLRELPTGGLVLTGGGSEMTGLADLVQKTLGGSVRIAYPEGIAGLPAQLRKPAFSAAVGLLLWGIKHQGETRSSLNGGRSIMGSKSWRWGLGRKKATATR